MPHKILLIGDSCVDEYYIGYCDRLSPEAPVPVIKIIDRFNTAGMAANVKANLDKLGCRVTFITNTEKIVKARYIDQRSGQHLLRVDDEPAITPWNEVIEDDLTKFDAVVISDYNKGFISYDHIQNLRRKFNGPIFIDTKKHDLGKFNGCFVKINETEYSLRTSDCDYLIVTLGSKGCMITGTVPQQIFAPYKVNVVDVCGAGDTFLSALVFEYLNTKSMQDAVVFANKASSLTVTRNGVYAPSLQEIMRV